VADEVAVSNARTVGRAPDAPYPGLRPFSQSEQDRFFGRQTEAVALAEFWQDNRIVLVTGTGGCGKTSLLQAGVTPILTEQGAHVLPPGSVSSGAAWPSAVLPRHNPYTMALLRSWSPGTAPARLVDLSVREFVQARASSADGVLYAALDHADDLLADPGPRRGHRDKFFAELADAVAAEPRLHLLLLAREDHAALVTVRLKGAARFDLTTLTLQDAVAAVTGPTLGTGRSFGAGAAEKFVTELLTSRIVIAGQVERSVRGRCVEPALLQVACRWLWDSLPPATEHITVRDIRLHGGVDKALAAYCGQVIAAVADDFDEPVSRIRHWLTRTFITEVGTRGMVPEGLTETAGLPNAIAWALADKYLLSALPRSGSRSYELLSDRLIQPLRTAVDELPAVADPASALASAGRALARGEPELAERYARAAQRVAPETDLWLHARVETLLGNIANEWSESAGAKAEAEAHYRAAARLFEAVHDVPSVASMLASVGQMLVAQDRREDALDELQAAVGRMPGDPVIQLDLAFALWGLGKVDAALAFLDAVLAADGGDTLALRARGEILADCGDPGRAMRDLNRVTLEKKPVTRAARGLALARLGDQPNANLEVDGAVAEAPRNGAVLLQAARAKSLSGDEGAAEDLARRAVDARDPGLPPYYREIALRLAGQKERQKYESSRAGVSAGRTSRPRPGKR
jgi:tetratricopeptide (TPR) repeat protein